MSTRLRSARSSASLLSPMVLVLATLSAHPAFSADLQAKAEARFEEGSSLIEKNGHESMVATKAGLERGIELVRRAMELGYPDTQARYLKLAEALNELAFSYYDDQSEQFGDLANHRDLLYRRLLDLYPDSAEVLYENAFLTEDPEGRKVLLRRAVEADSSHALSSYALGMQLIEEGNFKEGVPLARKGLENSDALVLQSYGSRLLRALRSAGLDAEAQDFEERFEVLLQEGLGRKPTN